MYKLTPLPIINRESFILWSVWFYWAIKRLILQNVNRCNPSGEFWVVTTWTVVKDKWKKFTLSGCGDFRKRFFMGVWRLGMLRKRFIFQKTDSATFDILTVGFRFMVWWQWPTAWPNDISKKSFSCRVSNKMWRANWTAILGEDDETESEICLLFPTQNLELFLGRIASWNGEVSWRDFFKWSHFEVVLLSTELWIVGDKLRRCEVTVVFGWVSSGIYWPVSKSFICCFRFLKHGHQFILAIFCTSVVL